MLMNKAVIVIRPRLMSPCICRYCPVSGAGVSRITRLRQSTLWPTTRLFFIRTISPFLSSSTQHPPAWNLLSHSGDGPTCWAQGTVKWRWSLFLSTVGCPLFVKSHQHTHTHTYKHRKALRCVGKYKKKQQANGTFNQEPLKFSSEHVKCCTQRYKIPMINTSCPTAKSILELCCIRSTKPHICRQSWRVKLRVYLLNAN